MRLTQLKTLSAEGWQILLTSLVLLPSIALALRLKGFKQTQAFFQRQLPEAGVFQPDAAASLDELQNNLITAQSVAQMVTAADTHGPYRANCSKRSLTAWWLLQCRGIAAELIIGVNRGAGDFIAHAWVEYMGNTLVEADDITERYSSFGPQ